MNTKQTSKYDSETGRKLSMGERYADAISQPVTGSGNAPSDKPSIRSFLRNELEGMAGRESFQNYFTDREIREELDRRSAIERRRKA